jgi:predicted amidohydrolase YtcJ
MIHARFARKEHLDKLLQFRVTPSFFTLHTNSLAEAHFRNRGKEATMYISPMRDAIDKGLEPTNHTDFVGAPLDRMFMLWSSVNRDARAGVTVGADQRITAPEGLKAMTR